MNQPFMNFDQQMAEKSGGSDFLQSGGAYVCTIEKAAYTLAKSGSHGIEFSVRTEDGLKANYITAYYQKADNSPIAGGQSLLSALMGFVGATSLSFVQQQAGTEIVNIVPELQGRKVGLFLQKTLYTKSNGQDGYRFEIRCPFDAQTKQTFKEKSQNKPAESIQRMLESYSDKDDRSAKTMAQQERGPEASAVFGNNTSTNDFDDDIQF